MGGGGGWVARADIVTHKDSSKVPHAMASSPLSHPRPPIQAHPYPHPSCYIDGRPVLPVHSHTPPPHRHSLTSALCIELEHSVAHYQVKPVGLITLLGGKATRKVGYIHVLAERKGTEWYATD